MLQDSNEIRLPQEERIRVRIFALAEHVAATPDNKLYISGAGVDTLWMARFPSPIVGLGLAVRIVLPWRMLSEPHTAELRILTEDRSPLPEVPNPAFSFPFELGWAPGIRPLDDSAVQMAINLTGVQIPAEGRYFIHLEIDGQELERHPFRVRRLPPPNAIRLGR